MNDCQAMLAIAIMSVVTAALRFAPFVIFSGKKTPDIIVYLGKVLPYAIMGMLVVYCLKDTTFAAWEGCLPALIASAVVVISHVLMRNTLISIAGGTVCYMILVQTVFA